ncbi:hypothetical protein CsSME_00013533 [Camellia sinensis var. sinensis]
MQAVASTYHQVLRFPAPKRTNRGSLGRPGDGETMLHCSKWQPST